MFCHLVAHSVPSRMVLADQDHAAWLWQRLREAFAEVLACVLMPDHLHLLARIQCIERARATLAAILGHDRRRRGSREPLWRPVPEPKVVHGVDKLRREVRYVGLNPCRAGLADDPLAWLWSTHRDTVGAVVEPWILLDRLCVALDLDENDARGWLHRYVTADPSVSVSGTPLPRAAVQRSVAVVPLSDIARAATLVTRARPDAIRRRGIERRTFVALAHHQGWTDTAQLAAATGAHPSTIRRLVGTATSRELAAATLCLGDHRLLRPRAR